MKVFLQRLEKNWPPTPIYLANKSDD
jgi:hypothetical protein